MTESDELLMTGEQILDGQQAWQSIGGQQVGSIWGHGAYQAPDWSADWLHRESMHLLDSMSAEKHGRPYAELDAGERTVLEAELRLALRPNTLDPDSTARSSSATERAAAMAHGRRPLHGPLRRRIRHSPGCARTTPCASARSTIPERLARLNDFFFWTSWACITERPGHAYTYTNNWPHDPLLGNHPTTANFFWSIASILLLLAAVGGMVWFHASRTRTGA